MQSRSLMSDPNRWKFPGDTFYVMSRKEILKSFTEFGHEVLDQNIIELAVDTSVEIANKCNVTFNWGKHYLPVMEIPKDDKIYNKKVELAKNKSKDFESNSITYLRHICQEGLKEKNKTSKEYLDRLNFELDIIENMDYPDYFLIVQDIMRFCRENNIPTGPARGCSVEGELIQLADKTIKKIEDAKVGEIIIGHDEKPHEIIDTLEYDCDEEVVTLEVENNKSLTMTKDHKVYAIKKEDFDKGIRNPKWYAMDDLKEGDYLCDLD